ncbi:peroxisome biogenesis factor 2-like isoform X2 [Mya arenaria]|uniref:peroxisome biogenesis factor 2-like isoform X2 n=1 Tax=Mya arenaria TaxID=6604 RepID=UPI0022E6C3D9|nr:peroxisome biogenesis factor 2-like isoform X2 [Mya arenaria]
MTLLYYQLDAAELDSEIVSLTKAQLTRLFKYQQNNFLATLAPEIDAGIKLLLWKFSIRAAESTFGQAMLNLKYHNEHAQASTNQWISSRQQVLYACLLIGCPWLKDRSHDLIKLLRLDSWKDRIDRMVSWLETGFRVATLVNFLTFLRNGAYQSVLERLLGVRSVFPEKQGMRQVTFEYMTRELLWHGFSELLFFVLPLINFQRIKNYVMRKLLSVPRSKASHNAQRDLTSCAVCENWPIRAQEIGCQHVFCYFCLQSNFKADPGFSCPLCGYGVGDISDIRTVQVSQIQGDEEDEVG